MRPYWLTIFLIAGTPLGAETQADGFASLRYGGLQNGVTAARAELETDWALGAVGLQIGANLASFDAEDSSAAFRAILTRDLRWPVRLGLSVAYETNDGVKDAAVTFGFHGLYRTQSTFVEVNLLLPNHIRETGTFSFNIAGEQWLADKLSVKTELYRLSTDLEDPDYYSISLQLNYAKTENLTVFAQGFQTTSDDYDIQGNGTHLGVAYKLGPNVRVMASLESLRPDAGDNVLGASVAFRYDFGSSRDQVGMFETAIIPDRFWIGAFEQRQ